MGLWLVRAASLFFMHADLCQRRLLHNYFCFYTSNILVHTHTHTHTCIATITHHPPCKGDPACVPSLAVSFVCAGGGLSLVLPKLMPRF